MGMKIVFVFDYLDYRKYLLTWIENKPGKGRGFKQLLAENSKCHSAYVSKVLKGSANFSAEQALMLSDFLGHTAEEREFFMLLVQYARAGDERLKQFYHQQIKSSLDHRNAAIKERLEFKKSLSEEDQAIYYSDWHYASRFIDHPKVSGSRVHCASPVVAVGESFQLAGIPCFPWSCIGVKRQLRCWTSQYFSGQTIAHDFEASRELAFAGC